MACVAYFPENNVKTFKEPEFECAIQNPVQFMFNEYFHFKLTSRGHSCFVIFYVFFILFFLIKVFVTFYNVEFKFRLASVAQEMLVT